MIRLIECKWNKEEGILELVIHLHAFKKYKVGQFFNKETNIYVLDFLDKED